MGNTAPHGAVFPRAQGFTPVFARIRGTNRSVRRLFLCDPEQGEQGDKKTRGKREQYRPECRL